MSRHTRFRLPPYHVEAALVSLAEVVDWGLVNFGIPAHWRSTQGAGVTVAVLDTGLDDAHPDLHGAVVAARDFTRSPWQARDRVGHGTHVAGIIAARQNAGGVVGVAPQCRLLVAKVLGDDGSGRDQDIAAGIDWAVDAGADVLSLSLGSPTASDTITRALERAVSHGRFVICAAGNSGQPNTVDFPARLPIVVAVGAVDRQRRLTSFSSQGDEVDVCAPGENVLSTWPGAGYAKLSGTSMAAPFVSGVVALAVAKHRNAGGATPIDTPAQLVEHLQRTAIDAGPTGRDPAYGYGLIDPARLLSPLEAPPIARCEIGPLEINGVRGMLRFVPLTAQETR